MREPSVADTLRASVCHNTLRGILQYSMGVYMTRAKGVARPMSDLLVSRRRLLRAGALGAGALALPAWARGADLHGGFIRPGRSEEHTSEHQSLMRISYAVFCLKKKNKKKD